MELPSENCFGSHALMIYELQYEKMELKPETCMSCRVLIRR
jgi:hypothetical protein